MCGLLPHSGVTPELAAKFIGHSQTAINSFIARSRYLKHMGRVGEWSDRDIGRLVLPTAGSMVEDELNDLEEAEDGAVTFNRED